MDYFNIDEEMGDVLDSCGGEDLLRWLLKDDGIANPIPTLPPEGE